MPNANTFDWRQFDAYLFDIDGTLLNAKGGVHYKAFHTALRQVYGCEGRIDAVTVHGNTDVGILRDTLTYFGQLPLNFEAQLPAAREIMCDEVELKAEGIEAQPCPGIYDLLALLRKEGKLLGVVTGNFERIGWCKLGRAGLRSFFSFGSFSDRHEKREDIFFHGVGLARAIRGSHASICFVGDTPNDIHAAAQLGLPIIAVATGVHSLAHLQRYSPTVCVSSCAVLLESAATESAGTVRFRLPC